MRRLHLLLLSAVFGLAGCAGLAGAPEAAHDRSPAFDGLAQLLGPEGVDVLLVHGMCTRDLEAEPEQRWSHQALQWLGSALGATPAEAQQGEQQGIAIHRRAFHLARGTVHANAIVWSPLTQGLKRRLCYDQTNASALCAATEEPDGASENAGRALFNAWLKDRMLDDCLADAMVFSGEAHDEMVARMQGAVLRALDPAPLDAASRSRDQAAAAVRQLSLQRPLVFIVESLGSTLTFDALAGLQEQVDTLARAAADRTRERTAQVFMFANQLPILRLAGTALVPPGSKDFATATAGSTPPVPPSSLARFLNPPAPRSPAERFMAPPRVISFNDRNDLLSYRLLSRGQPMEPGLDVIEVPVRNAVSVLGLFAAPMKAHSGHWSNPEVRRLLVCGHDSPTPCAPISGAP